MKPPKRKNRKKRNLNREYLFLVEGHCEQIYLNHIKSLINQELRKRKKSPVNFKITVTRDLRNEVKNVNLINEIYIVSDIEENTTENIKKRENFIDQFKLFKEKGIEVIWMYSNLSFESWILQHNRRPFKKSVVKVEKYLEEINKTFHTDFQKISDFKNQKSFKEFLKENIKIENVINAITNSQKLAYNDLELYKGFEYNITNPSTSFHIGLENILKKLKLDIS